MEQHSTELRYRTRFYYSTNSAGNWNAFIPVLCRAKMPSRKIVAALFLRRQKA